MKKFLDKIRSWYHNLPEKKKYVELITAVLSVPVMVTVIILNLNNLNQNKKQSTSSTSTTPIQIVITGNQDKGTKPPPPSPTVTQMLTSTPTASPTATLTPTECKKEVGPVEIVSPREGEIITKNVVNVKISTNDKYCASTWSYQIDDESWSEYMSNNEAYLYNLTNGEKHLLIRIKSTASDEEITIKRNFTYSGAPVPTATPTQAP